jgi:hypothetical protein
LLKLLINASLINHIGIIAIGYNIHICNTFGPFAKAHPKSIIAPITTVAAKPTAGTLEQNCEKIGDSNLVPAIS